VGSQIFGSVSEDVPSFTMYGKSLRARSSEVILESALSTQKRMMKRRDIKMSEALEVLIRSVYKMTKVERAFQRVSRTRFKLP
jgi:UDP-N-acetylglucosamine diphosphorylase / glucose-1-phosphate thymidylyltransferase / UDP-N-acetylgalactosamine diphosphorylase / glucosamine-1-phosphate N-acetyltransferase / galactosamine-1-phosphate N-acetyltransferase